MKLLPIQNAGEISSPVEGTLAPALAALIVSFVAIELLYYS